MEHCRMFRLTRNQNVLFRLGALIASTECAGALAMRARDAIEDTLDGKADTRFSADTLCAMARVMGRNTAMKIATDGGQLVVGALGEIPAGFMDTLQLADIIQKQTGLMEDMNAIADAIYDRNN